MRRTVTILVWVGGLLAILCAVFVPAEFVRAYVTVLSGCIVFVSSVFVFGFLLLSKPSRDHKTGKRRWLGERWWLLGIASMILLVYLNGFVFRLILPAPDLTPQQVAQQRFSAIVSSVVLLEQTFLTLLWMRRQISARRERRTVLSDPEPVDPDDDVSDEEESDDYWNGYPPSA